MSAVGNAILLHHLLQFCMIEDENKAMEICYKTRRCRDDQKLIQCLI